MIGHKRIFAMFMHTRLAVSAFALGALALGGCTTIDPATGQQVPNKTATGAIIGALGGAVAGTAAGGDDRRNAVIGAGIGALSGAAVGNYMDRQERELRQRTAGTGIEVVRTAEDQIQLVMPSDITFDYDRADVKAEFRSAVLSVADVLKSQPATTIDVIGHADATGSDSYNQTLSERRAQSVAYLLQGEGVQPQRVVAYGRGELQPIASNDNDAGRAKNRRVEIKLRAVQEAG
jgi:outer membrane protein OmpA-like peptidoglycan-associated protein